MPDFAGPKAFGALITATTRPAFTPTNAPGDPESWFQNCTSPALEDGTEILAQFLNFLLAQERRLADASGVAANNLDDYLRARAIRSQAMNFVPAASVGGTANAITLGFTPTFTAAGQLVGTPLVFLAEAANTGAVTIGVDGVPAASLTWPDGTALAAGDIATGTLQVVRHDGTAFRLLTPLSPTQVRALTSPLNRSQIFTASGTFTVPAGVTSAEVIVIGGGGGGGASANASGGGTAGNIGAGGGAGGYALRRTTGLTPGAAVTVTVGAGGTAPAAANGGAGGTSSFGAFVSATGGGGGGWGENTLASGGAGGNGASGDLNIQGGDGGFGGTNVPLGNNATQSDVLRIYGRGGVAAGGFSIPSTGGTGAAGRGHGTGGSGASGGSGVAGGAGAPGIVIVRW